MITTEPGIYQNVEHPEMRFTVRADGSALYDADPDPTKAATWTPEQVSELVVNGVWERSKNQPIPQVSVSFDTNLDGNLIVKIWDDDHAAIGAVFTGRVMAHNVPHLMQAAVQHGTNALQHVISAIAAGDCKTCGNFRMIETDKRGRMVREHCPDCTQQDPMTAIKQRPTWRQK